MNFPPVNFTHERTDDPNTTRIYGHIVVADSAVSARPKIAEVEHRITKTLHIRLYASVLHDLEDALKTFGSDPTMALTKLNEMKQELVNQLR